MLTPFAVAVNPREEGSRSIQLIGGPFHAEYVQIWDTSIRLELKRRPVGSDTIAIGVYRLTENGKWAFDAENTAIVASGGHGPTTTIPLEGFEGMTLGRLTRK